MTKLAAFGCSFTDKNFTSTIHKDLDTSYPKWPELLEGDWNAVDNYGIGGCCNFLMLENAIDTVLNDKKISTIVVALSNWLRYTLPDGWSVNPAWAMRDHGYTVENFGERQVELYEKMLLIEKRFPTITMYVLPRMDRILKLLRALSELCVYKNKKLIVFQMLKFADTPNHSLNTAMYTSYLSNKNFYALDDLNVNEKNIDFINWPFIDPMSKIPQRFLENDKFAVSKLDRHPNALGHQKISEWIHENAKFL